MNNYSKKMGILKAQKHKKLFHYTDYSTLKYIFEDENIRLSRIDKVRNDPQESYRLEAGWHTLFYVACFTNQIREDWYFWNEYGEKNNKNKIRIEFLNNFTNKKYYNIFYLNNNNEKSNILLACRNNWNKIRNRITAETPTIGDMYYNSDLTKKAGLIGSEKFRRTLPHACFAKSDDWKKDKETRLLIKLFNKYGKNIEYIFLKLDRDILDNLVVTFHPEFDIKLKEELKILYQNIEFKDSILV